MKNVIAFLSDEANLKIIVKDVLKYFDSRTDESEIKSIRKRIADIQEEADAAANAFIEAKSPVLKQRIEKRMQECEVLLADLEKVKARLIIERGQKLTEKDIVAFVNMILQGDIEDLEFRRRLIDNLVYKVYVSDDDTYIYFNIKGGNNIEEITLEDTKAALESGIGVQMRRDPLRQRERGAGYCLLPVPAERIKRRIRGWRRERPPRARDARLRKHPAAVTHEGIARSRASGLRAWSTGTREKGAN